MAPPATRNAKAPTKKTARAASSAAGAGPKRGRGRPTAYDANLHPQLAEAWASTGRTEDEIAEKLGVAKATITNWKNAHPDFLAALKRGKAEPDDRVEACLFARATGYDHEAVKIFMPAGAKAPVYAKYTEHTVPDVTAQIFWLKNRRADRWRDRVEHTGAEGGPIEVASLTPEERKARIAELLAKARS